MRSWKSFRKNRYSWHSGNMKNIYLKQHFSNVIKYFEYGIDIVMNTFKNIFIHRIITEKI